MSLGWVEGLPASQKVREEVVGGLEEDEVVVGTERLVVAQRHRGAPGGKAQHSVGSAAAAVPLDPGLGLRVLHLRIHGSGILGGEGWGLRVSFPFSLSLCHFVWRAFGFDGRVSRGRCSVSWGQEVSPSIGQMEANDNHDNHYIPSPTSHLRTHCFVFIQKSVAGGGKRSHRILLY